MRRVSIVLGLLGLLASSGVQAGNDGGFLFYSDAATGDLARAQLDEIGVQRVIENDDVLRAVAVDGAAGTVYFATLTSILRANRDGSNEELLYTVAGSEIIQRIEVDAVGGKMYWSESSRIQRANLDGSLVESIVVGYDGTFGMALDLVNGKLYFYDSGLRRCDLDGSNLELLISSIDSINDLAVDSFSGRLYWTVSVDYQKAIFYRPLAGGASTRLLSLPNGPRGLRADSRDGTLYVGIYPDDLTRVVPDTLETTVLLTGEEVHGARFSFDETRGELYWENQRELLRLDVDGDAAEVVAADGGAGSAYDPLTQRLYFANPAAGTIEAVENAGAGPRVTILTGQVSPHGIAIDPIDRLLYFSDRDAHVLRRCRLDGSDVETIVSGDVLSPRGIALDVVRRQVVWSGFDGSLQPAIMIANLDGSDRQNLGVSGLLFPQGVVVDPVSGTIYVTDSTAGLLRAIDRNGMESVVLDGLDAPRALAFDPAGLRLYYGETGADRIGSCRLDGTDAATVLDGISIVEGISIEQSAIEHCGPGSVGIGMPGSTHTNRPEPVLFVNASIGNAARQVTVESGAHFWCVLLRPDDGGDGRFVLHANPAPLENAKLTCLPAGIGLSCNPLTLATGAAPIAVWNNLGRTARVGESTWFDGSPQADPLPAPAFFVDLPDGDAANLSPGTRFLLQGVVRDPGSRSGVQISTTNAVEVVFD